MLKVKFYRTGGDAVEDYFAEDTARRKWEQAKGSNLEYHISQEILLLAFRVLIMEGVIPHDQIEFYYGDTRLPHNEKGQLLVWPKGLCVHEDLLTRMVFPKGANEKVVC